MGGFAACDTHLLTKQFPPFPGLTDGLQFMHVLCFTFLSFFMLLTPPGFEKTPKQIKLGKRKHLEDMPDDEGSSQYQPGGGGIHRQRDGEALKRKFGEEYKAKVRILIGEFIFEFIGCICSSCLLAVCSNCLVWFGLFNVFLLGTASPWNYHFLLNRYNELICQL